MLTYLRAYSLLSWQDLKDRGADVRHELAVGGRVLLGGDYHREVRHEVANVVLEPATLPLRVDAVEQLLQLHAVRRAADARHGQHAEPPTIVATVTHSIHSMPPLQPHVEQVDPDALGRVVAVVELPQHRALVECGHAATHDRVVPCSSSGGGSSGSAVGWRLQRGGEQRHGLEGSVVARASAHEVQTDDSGVVNAAEHLHHLHEPAVTLAAGEGGPDLLGHERVVSSRPATIEPRWRGWRGWRPNGRTRGTA
eukprot:scaffold19032_cov66-Phaeocystis_antarctica.AAC.5